MKKIIFTLLSAGLISLQTMGQACTGADTSGSTVCNTTGIVSGPGFQDPNSIPCVIQGVPYDTCDQFNMYNVFVFLGTQTVDSIEFLVLGGLPSGICWATNKANNRFKANESGCLNFRGTTNAGAGQYKLSIDINAWINGSSTPQRPGPYLVDQAGVKLWLRVQTPGGSCAAVDTSKATSINEISNDVTSFNVVPNPMSSNAVVTFVAEKSAAYVLNLADVTGKIISTRKIEAKAGENTTNIERNNLPAGVYFLSLSDGQSLVTRKFSIIE